ncbi:YeeE/YedE family protein [Clostridium bovifaecis]|uniref:YeeE/YedE family protein n=1 Tax=Clostridium bovifaecis TaxID=2184719 RepID=A0A6I6ER56_9CLOT|nr:YeeE/YedE family protein [Clostridium bovifaecis]
MLSNEMDLLIQQRYKKKSKKQKNQIPYAILVIVLSVIIFAFLWKNQRSYTVYLVIGIPIGITLRYSRFCLSGAFRDPFLLGNTRLLRGVLIAMIISTVGFGAIQYEYLKHNPIDYAYIPGIVTAAGFHIMVGAFIFGVGMTIAGGCASGVLMRIGEGHALQWITLLGFFIGSLLGAKDYTVWYDKFISKAKVIYFPEYLDLRIVVIAQVAFLITLYKIAVWYENKRFKSR